MKKIFTIFILGVFLLIIFNTCEKIKLPFVETTSISEVTQTTASSGGNVTDDGGAEVTARGVCWCENENPITLNHNTIDGSGTGSFTSNLTLLTPGATYYVRAYAINSAGTAYGNQVSFTTEALQVPILTTTAVTSVTLTTAVSGGNITSDGGGIVTARGVCWSTSPNPTTAASSTTDGSGTGVFTSNLTGLSPSTTYYVKAYAVNSEGTAYGNEVSFTTEPVVKIPDQNFLNALIEAGVDTDDNGFISHVEAQAITSLDVSEKNISDMTGIEAFINLGNLHCGKNQLTSLDVTSNTALFQLVCSDNYLTTLNVTSNTALLSLFCRDNQLTTLDVSNNTALVGLSCERNRLTTLDVSNNTALESLACSNNQLTTLDVSNNMALVFLWCLNNQLSSLDVTSNTALEFMDCSNNQLTTLDVSNNTALEYLYCADNQLTTLDVTNNTALKGLICGKNQLTTLNVTMNTDLESLFCYWNQLTSLDVTNNTALVSLNCYSNQLTTLDISNNTALDYIDLSWMPTLFQVCVWVMPFPPSGVSCDINGSPNIYFSADCNE